MRLQRINDKNLIQKVSLDLMRTWRTQKRFERGKKDLKGKKRKREKVEVPLPNRGGATFYHISQHSTTKNHFWKQTDPPFHHFLVHFLYRVGPRLSYFNSKWYQYHFISCESNLNLQVFLRSFNVFSSMSSMFLAIRFQSFQQY